MRQSPNTDIDPTEPAWGDDFNSPEDRAADFNAGLTSLGFIRAALRRSGKVWCAAAVAGFLIGLGVYVTSPPVYQAATTLLLTNGPESQPGAAVADAQTIVQSIPVARLAAQKLRLQESVGTFLGSYAATPLTDRALYIVVDAPTSSDARSRASALATAFLHYRAGQLQAQQSQLFNSLDQQINQARQHVDTIRGQIRTQLTQPSSPARRTQLSSLRTQERQAVGELDQLEQTTNATRANTRALTTAQITGSTVLNAAAPLAHSRFKHLVLYPLVGAILGLVLGLGVVIVRALISDRLRRRDDIAHALGAPVRLSVGRVRLSRWRSGGRGLAAANSTNVRRIAAYLDSAVPARSRGVAALAVIPVDDPQVAALSVVSLAMSCAERGIKVVVADLASGVPAGGLLGVKEAGVHMANLAGSHLVVAVPEPNDVAPIGPFSHSRAGGSLGEAIAAASASADLLLTFAPLDPSQGGEHLATWAADAVAVITAGRSSWTRIHAVSEMVRLAGTRLVSAVVVGADETDESLGMPYPPQDAQDAEAAQHAEAPPSGHRAEAVPSGQNAETAGNGQDAKAAGRRHSRPTTQDFFATTERTPRGR